jgi:very-short-patch-repair endonuclease
MQTSIAGPFLATEVQRGASASLKQSAAEAPCEEESGVDAPLKEESGVNAPLEEEQGVNAPLALDEVGADDPLAPEEQGVAERSALSVNEVAGPDWMVVQLKTAFQKSNAKEITAHCMQAVGGARSEVQLQIFGWVMQGYKSNNPAAQRKRLQEWSLETDIANAGPVLQKTMLKALHAKRQKFLHPDLPVNEVPLSDVTGIAHTNAAIASQLATLFETSEEAIMGMRRKGKLFCLIDIALLVTGTDTTRKAAQQIRRIIEVYPELQNNCEMLCFDGRGQKPVRCVELPILLKFMMRLPGTDPGKCLQACHLLGIASGIPLASIDAAAQEPLHREKRVRDEDEVARFLKNLKIDFTPQERIGHIRVDFLIMMPSGRIILEVDENQHKSYGLPSEMARTRWIQERVAQQGGSTLLIRFNPGKYRVDGQTASTSWKTRKDSLASVLLSELRAHGPSKSFRMTYLYYDMADMEPCILRDSHFPAALRNVTRIFDLGLQRFVG